MAEDDNGVVSEKASYSPRQLLEFLRGINGTITNYEVTEFLSCDSFVGRTALRTLEDLGLLKRTGEFEARPDGKLHYASVLTELGKIVNYALLPQRTYVQYLSLTAFVTAINEELGKGSGLETAIGSVLAYASKVGDGGTEKDNALRREFLALRFLGNTN